MSDSPFAGDWNLEYKLGIFPKTQHTVNVDGNGRMTTGNDKSLLGLIQGSPGGPVHLSFWTHGILFNCIPSEVSSSEIKGTCLVAAPPDLLDIPHYPFTLSKK